MLRPLEWSKTCPQVISCPLPCATKFSGMSFQVASLNPGFCFLTEAMTCWFGLASSRQNDKGKGRARQESKLTLMVLSISTWYGPMLPLNKAGISLSPAESLKLVRSSLLLPRRATDVTYYLWAFLWHARVKGKLTLKLKIELGRHTTETKKKRAVLNAVERCMVASEIAEKMMLGIRCLAEDSAIVSERRSVKLHLVYGLTIWQAFRKRTLSDSLTHRDHSLPVHITGNGFHTSVCQFNPISIVINCDHRDGT